MRGERAQSRKTEGRRSRAPLGRSVAQLAVDPIPGYTQHWFNDDPGRLDSAYDNDYEFVTKPEGSGDSAREIRVSKRVGVNEDGSPKMAYLMKKKSEWYEEDQAAKAAPLNEFEAAIKAGKPVGGTQESEAFYNSGSSLKTKT